MTYFQFFFRFWSKTADFIWCCLNKEIPKRKIWVGHAHKTFSSSNALVIVHWFTNNSNYVFQVFDTHLVFHVIGSRIGNDATHIKLLTFLIDFICFTNFVLKIVSQPCCDRSKLEQALNETASRCHSSKCFEVILFRSR